MSRDLREDVVIEQRAVRDNYRCPGPAPHGVPLSADDQAGGLCRSIRARTNDNDDLRSSRASLVVDETGAACGDMIDGALGTEPTSKKNVDLNLISGNADGLGEVRGETLDPRSVESGRLAGPVGLELNDKDARLLLPHRSEYAEAVFLSRAPIAVVPRPQDRQMRSAHVSPNRGVLATRGTWRRRGVGPS